MIKTIKYIIFILFIMDINRKLVTKSWNQGNAGLKSTANNKLGLGSFLLVNNLGTITKNSKAKLTTRRVSDSSDYTKFKRLLSYHKVHYIKQ